MPLKILCLLIILFISNSSQAKPRVVFSITPVASIAAMLLKDEAVIEVIANNSSCPHHYSARPSDLLKIEGADLLFFINENFDTFASKIFKNKGTNLIGLSEVPGLHLLKDKSNNINWHFWLDLDNVEILINYLYNIFNNKFPLLQTPLKNNYINAIKEIAELKELRRTKISNLKHVVNISDSAEYFFLRTGATQFIIPTHKTINIVNSFKDLLGSGNFAIAASPDQDLKFLKNYLGKIVIIESENWLIDQKKNLPELFSTKYKEIIRVLSKE